MDSRKFVLWNCLHMELSVSDYVKIIRGDRATRSAKFISRKQWVVAGADDMYIRALSEANFLASLPSPFYNLKIVKLPPGYEESSMSCSLRTYLLGVSPKDTIVTTLPQVCVESIAILFHYYNVFVVLLFCRCKSCNQEMTAEDAEDWMYNQLEDTTHLLHGVVHSNGYGHLLRVNGREGGSRVSVMDVSKKYGLEFCLIHAITKGHSWYGDWGYEFGAGVTCC
ncbi:hypothetical protein POM88_054955 [Heracleum sosnowskyi]|uniref:Uncharacterized protein n=1 Tax=Heracleum sosnowskyi TaxID=360622 RepID=A0AAD8GLS6_9APIA|nr:hypothetical protein POM88_054955 [Heracleum sosnowskyi]